MTDKLKNFEEMIDGNIIKELVREIGANLNYYDYIVGLIYSNEGKFTNAINHLEKYLEKEPNNYSANFLLGEIYIKQGEYLKASDCLKKIVFDIDKKEDFKKLESLVNILLKNEQFEIAKDLLSNVNDMNFQLATGGLLSWEIRSLVESEMHFKVLKARLDERNKIIADLSHSLKNIVATITDPLENLRQTKEYVDITIENALRGANLVREITNAMNYSLKGDIDDFYYDAKHNQGNDLLTLANIVNTSLRNAVANMFDTKYFSTFSKQYFPERESFMVAKSDWTKLGAVEDTDHIVKFMEKYLTKIEIDLNEVGSLSIGNDKGSAVKLMTIIQEMILNAIKYSSFVKRAVRFVRIKFSGDKKNITLSVENKFKPRVKVKTTGMGQVILKNFAEMLNTKLEVDTANDIYFAKFNMPNFWEGNKS